MQKTAMGGLVALGTGAAAAGGYLLLVLPWQGRWGATDAEVRRPLPGDELIPHPDAQWTRAITVHARAAAVWPWLVQIGHGRGGYYSYPWLERLLDLRATSRDRINPAWLDLKVGEIVPAEPGGSDNRVLAIEPGRMLLFGVGEKDEGAPGSVAGLYPAFCWVFVLEEREADQTRLLTRMRARTRQTPLAALALPFVDCGAFLLKRHMLLGLKERAARPGAQAAEGDTAIRIPRALPEHDLPGPGVVLAVGPDLVDEGQRKQHLEAVRPPRARFRQGKG